MKFTDAVTMNKKDKQITDSSGNVFADLGFERVEAAERFGVAQPRISEIYQGKIELFTIDKLLNMLSTGGSVC